MEVIVGLAPTRTLARQGQDTPRRHETTIVRTGNASFKRSGSTFSHRKDAPRAARIRTHTTRPTLNWFVNGKPRGASGTRSTTVIGRLLTVNWPEPTSVRPRGSAAPERSKRLSRTFALNKSLKEIRGSAVFAVLRSIRRIGTSITSSR